MNTAVFPDLTRRFGDFFADRMEELDLTKRGKAVWQFQYYMRHGITLSSGSIVDYRKYAARYLNETGELLDCLEDMSSHERAGVSKFREAEKADLESISVDNAKTNAKGELQSD